MAKKKTVVSYEVDMYEIEGYSVGKRDASKWDGIVETGFDYFFSRDPKIIEAYKKYDVKMFEQKCEPKEEKTDNESSKPVIKRTRRKPAAKKEVKNEEQILADN